MAALSAVICLASQAGATTSIDSITTKTTDSGLQIVVQGDDIPQPKETRSDDGKTYTLWFKATIDAPVNLAVNHFGVSTVKTGRRSRWSTFVVLQLDPQAKPVLASDPKGWIVKFGNADAPAAKPAAPTFPNAVPPLEAKPKPAYPTNIPPVDEKPKVVTRPDKVSLEFVNTDIVQILRALALQTGMNIVTSPDVKGSLTVSLNDVSVDQALRTVTGLAELGFSRVDDTVIVAPAGKVDAIRRQITGEAPAKPEEPLTDAYLVRGGSASDLVEAVAGKSANTVGHVSLLATPAGSASRQTVVLRGPEDEVKAVLHTLEELDDADDAIGSFEIYEVKHLDPRALREELINSIPGLRASILPASVGNPNVYKPNEITREAQAKVSDDAKSRNAESKSDSGGTAGAAGGQSSGANNDAKPADDNRQERENEGLTQPFTSFEKIAVPMKLVLHGTQAQITSALDYLKKIDVEPKQIAVELRVMELTKEDAKRIGLDWSILESGGTVQAFQLNQSLGDTASTPGTVSGTFSGRTNILGTLDQMANKTNLIARPNLLALDGRSAELFVGDVIRYIETIQTSQNGTTVQTGEEHVGVRLALLPRIGGDGTIVMEMRPIVSYLTGYTPVPGGGELPQTSERIEETTTIMRSGETIALGGLIQDQDTVNVSGIPFLKDLPIVGQLFRRTNKDRQRSEVVFFITAKVVDDKDKSSAADPRQRDPEEDAAIRDNKPPKKM
jgi:type II secretory pathway component GspD/PulD (secretin)